MTQELLQLVISGRLSPEDAKLVQQAAARICMLEEGERLKRRVGNLENQLWRLENEPEQVEFCECDLCVPPEFHDGFCCEQCPED